MWDIWSAKESIKYIIVICLIMIRFVDREEELALLHSQIERKKAGFVVIYGRRRTGKTELALRLLQERPGIYYLADRRSYIENIRGFQRIAAEFLGDELLGMTDFKRWTDAFAYVSKKLEDGTVIVIDEFPYLLEKGVLEEFQKVWDTILSKRNLLLILIGSSVSMMEKSVLSYGSPLYGRRTAQIRLEPLRFRYMQEFFPSYSFEELLKVCSVLDGIPQYINLFSGEMDFRENMLRNYLIKGSPLYEDAEVLLRDELREVRRYFGILEAVARGKRNFTEIKNELGMESNTLSRYLNILLGLGFLKEDLPAVGRKKLKRYRISDNYFSFWFRYIYPNRWMVEAGKGERLMEYIEETLNQYLSLVFEDVVREILTRQTDYGRAGQWWNRRGDEIDIVALNEKKNEILFGEVKWRNRAIGWNVVEELIEKKELVQWHNEDRKERFLVVSKSGFTKKCLEKMEEEGIIHWELKDVEGMVTGA